MKFAQILINNVLIPVFTFILFLIGILAASISALIEYSVFEQFFESSYMVLLPSGVIAFAIVIAFEYTKIYLHFLLNRVQVTDNEKYRKKYKRKQYAKYFLVSISLVCSVFYSISALHLASYDENTVEQKIAEINAELENDIANVISSQNENYELRLAPYEEAKNNAATALAQFNPDGLSYWQANMTLQALEENVATTEDTYNQMQTTFDSERTTAIDNETKALTTEANNKIDALNDTSSAEVAAKYDNQILAQCLTVLANTLFGMATYPRIAYLIVCIAIGIIVSVMLEYVISFTFSYMSEVHEINLCDHINVDRKFQERTEQFIIACIKAFCALTVYIIIISIFSRDSVTRNHVWFALAAYILAICMEKLFLAKDTKLISTSENTKIEFYLAAKESIIQGVLSFAGFILLGFAFGEDAVNLDLSTIAIGIGATLSSLAGKVPEKILSFKSKI